MNLTFGSRFSYFPSCIRRLEDLSFICFVSLRIYRGILIHDFFDLAGVVLHRRQKEKENIILNPLLSKGSIARDTPQKPAILHFSLRYASTKNKPYAQ